VIAGLALFVKTPGRSPVKSRLWPAIGRDAAEALYLDCAAAVAEAVAALEIEGRLHAYWAVAEAEADGEASRPWTGLPRIAQGPGTLGERMARVSSLLRHRHGAALIIGTDVPQLTAGFLRPAVDWLVEDRADVVLGPSADGGFWLVGSRVELPLAAWTAPRYSTAQARADFLAALPGGLRIAEVQSARDLDEPQDIPAVAAALAALPSRSAGQARVWHRLDALSGKLRP
jgi:glycosyltransferase A (GT-A) superfamily protein (DUF2064 family)